MSRAKPASTELVSGVAGGELPNFPLNAKPAVAPTSSSTTAPAAIRNSSVRELNRGGAATTPPPTGAVSVTSGESLTVLKARLSPALPPAPNRRSLHPASLHPASLHPGSRHR